MARTFGGLAFYTGPGLVVPTAQGGTGASLLALVRNALGDWSLNNTTPGVATYNVTIDNSVLTRPYIQFPSFAGQGTVLNSNEFQEAFGTSATSAGATGPGNPYSGVAAGSTSATTGLVGSQFGTPAIPWGIALIDVFAVYSVQTAALTTATLAVNRNIFVENTATTNTAVLAATAVAVTTTTSATTPHVARLALAQPLVYEMADFSNLLIELNIVTAGTSALRVYGIGCHYEVEYS